MLPEELSEYFVSIGEPKFRAKQLFPRLALGESIGEITNLPKKLRERLEEETLDTLPRVEKKLVSRVDGTVKYLFRLYDGDYFLWDHSYVSIHFLPPLLQHLS